MEVHHHAHHHGKKNWKAYFWEFLMLFLAVFCGSMAEYQLEHKIERDREYAYVKSMIEDLQQDTAKLRLSMIAFDSQDPHFDTIINCFDLLTKGYDHQLRNSLGLIIGYRDFFPTDKTLQQLKNAGGLRLIRNKKAADGITLYDTRLKEHEKTQNNLEEIFLKFYDLHQDLHDNLHADKDKAAIGIEAMEQGNKNYLLRSDAATLGQYYNKIKVYRSIRKRAYTRMQTLQQEAVSLMQLLREAYKLTS